MRVAARTVLALGLLASACTPAATRTVPSATPIEAPTRAASETPRPEPTDTEPPAPTEVSAAADCLAEDELPANLQPGPPLDEVIAGHLSGGSVEELESVLAELCEDVWGVVGEPLRYELTRFDVDGDDREDVLFTATRSIGGGNGDTYASAYLQRESGYEWQLLYRRAGAGSGGEGLYAGGGARILHAGDANRNGDSDIVVSVRWPEYGRILVAEWANREFESLIRRTSPITFEEVQYLEYERGMPDMVDRDGDGRQELVIVTGLEGAAEPISEPLQRLAMWSWTGELYEPSGAAYEPEPVYRIEALNLGELAWNAGDMDQALIFYQQAVFDEALLGWAPGHDPEEGPPASPDPDERERINAFGRLRILMVHASRGSTREAEIVHTSLLERVNADGAGAPYREVAEVFWQAYEGEDGGFWSACRRAGEYAASHAAEILEPLGKGYYGEYGREFVSGHLCPSASLE